MKKYTKTHKTKKVQDAHIALIKSRGGKVTLLHQGGDYWRFEYTFDEKQKHGPKKGSKMPKAKKETKAVGIKVVASTNERYSILVKRVKSGGKRYVASKESFESQKTAVDQLKKDGINGIIVEFKNGTFMPYYPENQ
jgi:hypothetical protein